MAGWTQKAYDGIVAKYPDLEGKTETVAIAVWAYEQDPDIDTAGFKELSEKTGFNVAGRAVGSAREILGLKPATKKKGGKRKKRGRKQSARRPSQGGGDGSIAGLVGALETLKHIERNNTKTRKALEKIRDLCDSALAE